MLTLFHAPHSRATRILWLLEELGADYALRTVGIRYSDGRGGAPDPANPHPDKKVPALLHDDLLVTESTAVALYLCDLHPAAGLAPRVGDADRGPFLTWLCWTDNELGGALCDRILGRAEARMAHAGLEPALRRLANALEKGRYLMGERFTAADVMAGSLLGWGRAHLPASEALDGYLARITGRPAFARAQAKDAPVARAA